MGKYQSVVTVRSGNTVADGKSVLSLMASGIEHGAEITVECSGADEEAMLSAAAALLCNDTE